MRIPIALLRFAVLAMILAYAALTQAAQPVPLNTFTFTAARGQRPGATAHITRIWVRTSPFGRSGQTGSLLIHYSDGASLVLWRAPHQNVMTLQANSPSGIVPAGAEHMRIAQNGRTAGWAALAATCCQSYPIPVSVGIYRSGQRVLHISGPGMLAYWNFLGNGTRIVAVWGPSHGPQVLEYQIIDLSTHHVLAQVSGNPNTQKLDPNAPTWALKVQASCCANL